MRENGMRWKSLYVYLTGIKRNMINENNSKR